jgi:predicted Zn-dependent peptidase
MQNLKLNQKKLDVQKKVVVEEFYETCLNQPYGDVWHHLSDLAYDKHHYKWPTIGMTPDHIHQITLEESQEFYNNYYQPSNAILAISGKLDINAAKAMIEQYFSRISNEHIDRVQGPNDSENRSGTRKKIDIEVPLKALYVSFPMPSRSHKDFYVVDLISDLLSYGRSSRLYVSLFQKQQLFTSIDAYVSGTADPGMFIVESKLMDGVKYERAESAIIGELAKLMTDLVSEKELQKVKNKVISNLYYSQVSVLSKAMNLAYFESIGDLSLINKEIDRYEKITSEDIHRCAQWLFDEQRANFLYYGKE